MKTKVEIDLNQEQIDKLVTQKVRELEKQNNKLQKRVWELEKVINYNNEKLELAENICKTIRDSGLYHSSDGCYGG